MAKSGYIKGNPHDEGGVQAINTSTGEPLEVEGGEIITCTKVVDDPKVRTYTGSNIEILDQMQRQAGCRGILVSIDNKKNGGMKTYKKGGVVGEVFFIHNKKGEIKDVRVVKAKGKFRFEIGATNVLAASSSSLEGIKKLISEFYYGSTISLVPETKNGAMKKGGKVKDKKWIQGAIKHPGILKRKALEMGLIKNIDEDLSQSDLNKLSKLDGKYPARVRLAKTLKKFDKEKSSTMKKPRKMQGGGKTRIDLIEKARGKTLSRKKIPMKKITIHWAEGLSRVVDQYPKDFTSWEAANDNLRGVGFPKGGGYNKVKFTVYWEGEPEDGYTGRLDMSENEDNPFTTSNVIGDHIREFIKWHLSDKNTSPVSTKERKEFTDFLSDYDLGDGTMSKGGKIPKKINEKNYDKIKKHRGMKKGGKIKTKTKSARKKPTFTAEQKKRQLYVLAKGRAKRKKKLTIKKKAKAQSQRIRLMKTA